SSSPFGINNSGQIVGAFETSTGEEGGFLDTNGSFTTINVPGALDTIPIGINQSGQIVGTFDTSAVEEGFLAASMATDNWIGGTDVWNGPSNAHNWTTGEIPRASDTVIIGTGPGGTVTFNDSNDTISGLTLQGDYTLDLKPDNVLNVTSGGQVVVGDASTGTLTIESGAVLSSATDAAADGPSGIIGNQANSNGTVQVTTAGEWNDAGSLVIGNSGDGGLKIQSGGIVNDASVKIGVAGSSSGIVDVNGAGSQWNNLTGQVEVGVAGLGSLSLEAGATGSSGGGLDIGVATSAYSDSMT
ncbi:MAG: hypothetical protein ACRD2G_16875, partial [Terriglobia bacterium]